MSDASMCLESFNFPLRDTGYAKMLCFLYVLGQMMLTRCQHFMHNIGVLALFKCVHLSLAYLVMFKIYR